MGVVLRLPGKRSQNLVWAEPQFLPWAGDLHSFLTSLVSPLADAYLGGGYWVRAAQSGTETEMRQWLRRGQGLDSRWLNSFQIKARPCLVGEAGLEMRACTTSQDVS